MKKVAQTVIAADQFYTLANAAGKVIEVVGTTFGEEGWEDIFRLTHKVRTEKYLF